MRNTYYYYKLKSYFSHWIKISTRLTAKRSNVITIIKKHNQQTHTQDQWQKPNQSEVQWKHPETGPKPSTETTSFAEKQQNKRVRTPTNKAPSAESK